VGVQQGQPARDLGGLGAFLFLVLGLFKEQRSNVAVAKALDRLFTSIDGCQQLGIRPLKRVECAVPTLVPTHRLAHLGRLLRQGSNETRRLLSLDTPR
jgi:hypothetical protein